MGLMNALGINTAAYKPAAVESSMESGGIPAEGKHHAILDGFRLANANSGASGRELTFKIIGGPSRGLTVKETLWNPNPDLPDSDERKQKSVSRILLFAHRLGVVNKKGDGANAVYEDAPGVTDFSDRFGAEVVIEVHHEEYERKDGKGKGKAAKLTFGGIFCVNDPKVKDVPRGSAAGMASSQTTAAPPAAAGGKRDTYADL